MEAVRSERLSSVEQKEDKVEQLKSQVASLLQQSARYTLLLTFGERW